MGEFKVGDLVTRGRGRVTLRVVKVLPGNLYKVVDVADHRNRPREIEVAGSNLRYVKEQP